MDALVAIRDGEPLREAHRRVLGGGVRSGAELREEAGGARGHEKRTAAALHHRWHKLIRRDRNLHHVDIPSLLPVVRIHIATQLTRGSNATFAQNKSSGPEARSAPFSDSPRQLAPTGMLGLQCRSAALRSDLLLPVHLQH